VAASLTNLALVRRAEGDAAEAESLQREALAIRVRVLGYEHRDVAESLSGLADALSDEGRLVEARDRYEEALKIRRSVLPLDSIESAPVRNCIEREGDVKHGALFLLMALFFSEISGATALAASEAMSDNSASAEILVLREELFRQRAEIEALRRSLEEQRKIIEGLAAPAPDSALAPSPDPPPPAPAPLSPAAQSESEAEPAGLRLSGDFRFRTDLISREGNLSAPPVRNFRERYRLRFNVDKDLSSKLSFRFQLATGAINNGITFDQDMAATVAHHPLFISEAYVDFKPSPRFTIRGGRMAEVFADETRFLWDDDVRFNGFHQVARLPLALEPLGFTELELRAGEYILSHPNVAVLSPSSPYVAAGFEPGEPVGTANLFHPGLLLRGNLGGGLRHQIMLAGLLYRNPNQIALASTAEGFPVVVSNSLGLQLSGPMTGVGNATTTPGGATYDAEDFQIVHLGYRLERESLRLLGREMPAFVDFQFSRNAGASRARDAWQISGVLGRVRGLGDFRAIYQYSVKDANALVSQFTDDDLGSGSGVNVSVHAVRLDAGLARFLQVQNLFFFQNQRLPNDPASAFFVPLPEGANMTFRYQGQVLFVF
jgi:tetratricopeptide (TPR) repeat protein